MATATANKWILGETAKALAEVNAALEDFRFDYAAQALYSFVGARSATGMSNSPNRCLTAIRPPKTRATMGFVLDQCMILLHPFMPFITEELWATTASVTA